MTVVLESNKKIGVPQSKIRLTSPLYEGDRQVIVSQFLQGKEVPLEISVEGELSSEDTEIILNLAKKNPFISISISQCTLSSSFITDLLNLLKNQSSFVSLKFKKVLFSKESFIALCKFLIDDCPISKLCLNNISFPRSNDNLLKELGKSLANNSHITTLKFNANLLGEALSPFLDELSNNTSITQLDLSANNLSQINIINKIFAIKNLKQVNLDFNNFGLGLNSSFVVKSDLESLSLSRNLLNAKGGSFVLESLKNSNIKQLNLSNNHFDKTFIDPLKHFLDNNFSLTDLDLSYSKSLLMNNELAEALLTTNLKILNLSYCNLERETINLILETLAKHTSLQSLDLSNNLSVNSEKHLFSGPAAANVYSAPKNHTLKYLNLSHCDLTAHEVIDLFKHMPFDRLETLDISGSELLRRNFSFIRSYILINPNLKRLVLEGINLKCEKRLQQFMLTMPSINFNLSHQHQNQFKDTFQKINFLTKMQTELCKGLRTARVLIEHQDKCSVLINTTTHLKKEIFIHSAISDYVTEKQAVKVWQYAVKNRIKKLPQESGHVQGSPEVKPISNASVANTTTSKQTKFPGREKFFFLKSTGGLWSQMKECEQMSINNNNWFYRDYKP